MARDRTKRTKRRRSPQAVIDPREQQYCLAGKLLLDVEHAHRLIRAAPRSPVPIEVEVWARIHGLDGNPDSPVSPGLSFDPVYARTCDLARPLILAAVPAPEGDDVVRFVLDGTHRLFRGFAEGVELLPAYLLTVAETTVITRSYRALAPTDFRP